MRRSTGSGVSRRALLAGGAAAVSAAVLAGCQGAGWYPAEISPDEYVLRGAITEKQRLIARYEAAIEGGDAPGDLLAKLLGHHEEHLKALRDRLPEDSGGRDPAPTSTTGPSPEPVSDDPLSVAALQVAEETAAGMRGRDAAKVADRSLAQLLVSVGACEVGHAHLLSQA
ncbi:hypothetical protein CLV63_101534 [Murinocardiopsis flavida]|uniref:Ferritin-like protein n=1 Tax=Murinocardiopsis flavida TaxID=645275 RepID=A0A2P8DV21_9ACTN|nr:hypothetical protein [Murinocardiopsis flavida]PSL01055.1 hypothetical protein CLV63_101534 [Murinocardiopsis flavida]